MEDNIKLLITQVTKYLEELVLREPDKFQVYNHFISQCDQFDIDEEGFYKDVLVRAYKAAVFPPLDEPDPRNKKNTSVDLFGEKIHSLKKLGKVLFDHPSRAVEYFEDMSMIKTHVDTLETGDEALEYGRIYKSETDFQKRYLKIIYHLHPKLPYRIESVDFQNLSSIFDRAFEDQAFYNAVYNEFASGRLLIWLSESDPEQAVKIAGGKSYNSFLRFIYKVDPAYPFYLGNNKFANVQEIVQMAQTNLAFRKELFDYTENEHLFTWFESIGKSDWQIQYLPVLAKVSYEGIDVNVKANAAVHKLIRILDPQIAIPQLITSAERLSFDGIEAGKIISAPISINLINKGFVRGSITLDATYDGISLDKKYSNFFDLTGDTQTTFSLQINPLLLIKDKHYNFNILIVTDYQKIEIPVVVKAIFPMKLYLLNLAKYAGFGFIFFAIIRVLLGTFTKTIGWLDPTLVKGDFGNTLPASYPVYILVFLILVAALAAVVPLIRKYEKI